VRRGGGECRQGSGFVILGHYVAPVARGFYYLDPGSVAGVTPPTNNQQPFPTFFLTFDIKNIQFA
jgi:hypothetical protein